MPPVALPAVSKRSSQCQVPGIENPGKCLARLSSRSALLTDLTVLLDAGGALEPERICNLVVEENLLARGSMSARTKLLTELRGRYFLNPANSLFAAFLDEWCSSSEEHERALLIYTLLCLNDRTVTVLSCDWLFPRLRQQRKELRTSDLEVFLRSLGAGEHPEIAAWTPKTLTRVAQHYLASIRDAGLAKGSIKKEAVRPSLYPAPVRLLLRALKLAGVPLVQIVTHESFKILGIAPDEVVDALSELNRQASITFRQQADVIELTL